MKRIIFCGGGSGGHVMPAITLIKEVQKVHPDVIVEYVGSYSGIEKRLVTEIKIPYHSISTGKIRRYFSVQNFIDIFKVGIGFLQAIFLLARFSKKNTVIFSTGGFVSVPVVLAAKFWRMRIYVHEQTSRLGLANKIASKVATKFFISFPETKKFVPSHICVHSGYPVRDAFYNDEIGNVEIDGVKLNSIDRPICFVTGGGNGSTLMNNLVKKYFKELTAKYFVLHQVGAKEIEEYKNLKSENYLPIDFLGQEMIDVMKMAELIISRSGAGTVCELMALGKKSIFIPLKIAQKNEQYHNAMEAKNSIGSVIIEEDELESVDFLKILELDFGTQKSSRTMSRAQDVIINEIFK